MKTSRFTEPQIIKIVSEQDHRKRVSDICRTHGISQPTFYNWKKKPGGTCHIRVLTPARCNS